MGIWENHNNSLKLFFLLTSPKHCQVPLMRIKSLCQNRIPGSVAQVCVMPICEPGEVCQDHIKMTINTGHTIHILLIPIWVIITMFIQVYV